MPSQAKRNAAQPSPLLGNNADEGVAIAADTRAVYDTFGATNVGVVADTEVNYDIGTNLDSLIEKVRGDMERAAKSLDFIAAARYRDRMYELQQIKQDMLENR